MGDPGNGDGFNRTLLAEREGAILFLTLNRPEAMNAVDLAMSRRMAELAAAMPALAADAKVIVLRAAGSSFMAGGDIEGFQPERAGVDERLSEIIDGFHRFVTALTQAPQPVLCSVQGAAAGGGFSLAIGCDLVVAGASARFVPAYRKLGTSADGGATYMLPRLIGPKRAMDLLLLRDRIDADEALALGLVNRVVPDDRLDEQTRAIAGALAANSAAASASTKALLRVSLANGLVEQLALERDRFVAGCTGPDFAEGVAAFLEKRVPRFEGAPAATAATNQ